jgi:hypothetical protein
MLPGETQSVAQDQSTSTTNQEFNPMKTRANIAVALLLIAIGVLFLVIQIFPGLKDYAYGLTTWPMLIVAVGALLGLISLVTWVPDLWIPACIVGGIGGLLYWQNATGNWGSWAYAWTLIPGFVGIGLIVTGLLRRQSGTIRSGGWTIFISLILFAFFGSFLGGFSLITQYWPILLIVLGALILARSAFRRSSR